MNYGQKIYYIELKYVDILETILYQLLVLSKSPTEYVRVHACFSVSRVVDFNDGHVVLYPRRYSKSKNSNGQSSRSVMWTLDIIYNPRSP